MVTSAALFISALKPLGRVGRYFGSLRPDPISQLLTPARSSPQRAGSSSYLIPVKGALA